MKNSFCIIVANYYPKISEDLLKGAISKLKKNNIKKIKIIYAPGVFEIPVILSRNIKKFDAFVCLGCVIKGETPHFDYICSATINSLLHISINYKKPIGNGILTCLNMKQAQNRSNINKKDKGGEAANAAIKVLEE